MLKTQLTLLTVSFFLALLTARIFIFSGKMSLVTAIFTTLLTTPVLAHCIKLRRINSYDNQFLWLLEYIAAAQSSGSTIEKSINNASEDLMGQDNIRYKEMTKALKLMQNCLAVHLDFDQALSIFLNCFRCKTSRQIFGILSELRRSGGRIERYIQDSCKMLREKLELKRTIESEQSTKATETYIMAAAPFALAFILKNTGDYQSQLLMTSWGSVAMLAVYVASFSALMMVFLISNAEFTDTGSTSKNKLAVIMLGGRSHNTSMALKFICYKPAIILKRIYQNLLPESLFKKISSQLESDCKAMNLDLAESTDNYFSVKVQAVIVTVIMMFIAVMIYPDHIWMLLTIPVMPAIQDLYVIRRYMIRKSQENLLYPQWLSLLTVLLSSGLTLQRALTISCQNASYSNQSDKSIKINYFNVELATVNRQLNNGVSPATITSELSKRCSLLQVKHVLELIVRYDREGSNELLEIISLGTSAAWYIYRDELRNKLQAKTILYLIPSALSLLAVIAAALIPAVASLMIRV